MYFDKLAGLQFDMSESRHVAVPNAKRHGLRMINKDIFTHLPLSSTDSTNIINLE